MGLLSFYKKGCIDLIIYFFSSLFIFGIAAIVSSNLLLASQFLYDKTFTQFPFMTFSDSSKIDSSTVDSLNSQSESFKIKNLDKICSFDLEFKNSKFFSIDTSLNDKINKKYFNKILDIDIFKTDSLENKPSTLLIASRVCDTTVTQGGSLILLVYVKDKVDDSLAFRWFINGKLQVEYNDSTLIYTANDLTRATDTITVAITDIEQDSILSCTWFINIISQNQALQLFSFSPNLDTTVIQGDSLILSVRGKHQLDDSLAFRWFINGEVVEGYNDSTWLYAASSFVGTIDTVTVSIAGADLDSALSQSWHITVASQSRPPQLLSYFPMGDTTVTLGDSLDFLVYMNKKDGDSLNFYWSINGELVDGNTDSTFLYTANNLPGIADTIIVAITDTKHDSVFVQSWFIAVVAQNRLSPLLSFSPTQDTTVIQGDSLTFAVYVRNENSDYLNFNWFIDGEFVDGNNDSTLLYIVDGLSWTIDTVTVVITDTNYDSVLNQSWFITVVPQTQLPQILSFFPGQDTTVIQGDSLILTVHVSDEDSDYLDFRWFVNSELIDGNNDSILLYKANDLPGIVDTIAVAITDTNHDSMLNQNWLITIASKSRLPKLLSHFPSQDTIVTQGDSLILNVHVSDEDDDSLTFNWFVNGELFDSYNDSILLYIAEGIAWITDTITVTIADADRDSMSSQTWLITIVSQNRSPQFLSFSPTRDTTIMQKDSLTFAVYVRDEDSDSLFYRWFINGELIADNIDSTLQYTADSLAETIDSVTVTITDSNYDSVLSQSWFITVVSQARPTPLLSFSPTQDTTVMQGDSLFLAVHVSDHDSLSFLWYVDGELIDGNNDSTLLYAANTLPGITDTIRVAITDANHDSIFSQSWLITVVSPNRSSQLLSFIPRQDTTVIKGDSLIFAVHVSPEDSDSLDFRWFVNSKLLDSNYDSTLLYVADGLVGSTDTITVTITDSNHDSVLSQSWSVTIVSLSQQSPLLSFSPSQDTTVTYGDSLILAIHELDEIADSLAFHWFINGELVDDHNDSTFLYKADNFAGINDTITVVITNANVDSMLSKSWFITVSWEDRPSPQLFSLFPTQDTTVIHGDSLILAVLVNDQDSDSLKFHWYINNELVDGINNSTLLYTASSLAGTIDTVTVSIADTDNDSVFNWNWFIVTASQNQLPQLLSYFPRQDTTVTLDDSLNVLVQVSNQDIYSLTFRWHVNGELIDDNNDPTLLYTADGFAGATDTIECAISDSDTIIIFQWLITGIDDSHRQTLPCPKLIFPTGENSICEDDYFIWSKDSLSFSEDLTIKFIVQIAEDSLFSKILSVDTCLSDTLLNVDEISGFANIEATDIYYWRVKTSINGNQESRFNECKYGFTYLPSFVELINFYGELNIDGNIMLQWQTNYEQRNLGFNLYRSNSTNGNFIKINENIIIGKNLYFFIDQSVKSGETLYYKLEEVSLNGKTKTHGAISVTAPLPEKFDLYQNYPNPFNKLTFFKYQIPAKTHVVIEIFNVLGRKIRILIDEKREPGFYTISWDGLDSDGVPVVSGIYFYQMYTNTFRATRKMTVVR